MRAFFGGIVLFVIFFKQVKPVLKWPLIGKMMATAVFGVLINQVLFLEGVKRSIPLHAAVLANTIPVFSTLLAIVFGFERLSWRLLTAIFIGACASIGFILSGQSLGGEDQIFGDLLILCNILSLGVSFILFKKWMTGIDSRAYTAFALTFVGLCVLVFRASSVMGFVTILPEKPDLAFFVFYEVIVATSIAYLLNFYALKHLSISTVTAIVFIQPMVTYYFSQWMGHENRTLTMMDYGLFGLIIFAVSWILHEKRRARLTAV